MFNFNNSINTMTHEEIILKEIEEFNACKKRNLMLVGEKYYDAENDIANRKITRSTADGDIEDKSKSNNKLIHSFMTDLVDEKVGYLLSRPFSFDSEDTLYIDKVKDVLSKEFQYEMAGMGVETANKGIGYWYIYIDEEGKFKYMKVPSEQCIPIWTDNSHRQLQAMIRYYTQIVYEGKEKKEIMKVEYHTTETSEYFTTYERKLIYDVEAEPTAGPVGHYLKGGEHKSWGKVPFIVFKNNRREIPDIKYVKSLIDDYDLRRSDVSNVLEECKNFIYVIKNYGGEDLGSFIKDLNYYRAIQVDEDGGVDTLTPTIDNQASKEHFEQLKRDIKEFGRSVNLDLDKMGSAPSGIALKFLYSKLDLKCNNLELEFLRAWDLLQYFVDVYLSETSQGNYLDVDVEIVFNRDIAINETESVTNAKDSKGIISDRTIIVNHPWVTDLEAELKQIEDEKNETLDFDMIPGGDDDELLGKKARQGNERDIQSSGEENNKPS
ncbi:phage portal protein [Clostridium algidicarnis]|uniref:phage portal protein n=1 Tax=Clostridium algidicarnis TaxID=37659 RepID=UPI003FD77654